MGDPFANQARVEVGKLQAIDRKSGGGLSAGGSRILLVTVGH